MVKTAGTLDFETQSSYTLEVTCTDGTLSTTDTITVNLANAVNYLSCFMPHTLRGGGHLDLPSSVILSVRSFVRPSDF